LAPLVYIVAKESILGKFQISVTNSTSYLQQCLCT